MCYTLLNIIFNNKFYLRISRKLSRNLVEKIINKKTETCSDVLVRKFSGIAIVYNVEFRIYSIRLKLLCGSNVSRNNSLMQFSLNLKEFNEIDNY